MELTEQEGKDFWPFYDMYQKELQMKNSQLVLLISEYAEAYNKGPIANDIAAKLIKEYLNVKMGSTGVWVEGRSLIVRQPQKKFFHAATGKSTPRPQITGRPLRKTKRT